MRFRLANVVRRQHDDLLAQEIDHLESLDVQRPAHERHVKGSRPQSGDGLDGVPAVQDEAEVRQVRAYEWAQWRKDSDVGGRKGSDRQIAGAPAGRLLGEPPRVFDASEDVLRLTQEDAAGVGERHVMTTPIEERDANLRFELPDLLAE